MLKRFLNIVVLMIVCSPAFAQQVEQKLAMDVGIIARTTIFYYRSAEGQTSGPLPNADAPFDYRKGVNGTGLNMSVGYYLSNRVGLHTSTTVRYDFYKFKEGKDESTFYFDQSIFVSHYFTKKFYLGFGGTVFNIGKELHFTNGGYGGKEQTLKLQFLSLDVLAGRAFGKIYVEPKISIVPKDFPGTIKDNATLLGIKVYYRFNL